MFLWCLQIGNGRICGDIAVSRAFGDMRFKTKKNEFGLSPIFFFRTKLSIMILSFKLKMYGLPLYASADDFVCFNTKKDAEERSTRREMVWKICFSVGNLIYFFIMCVFPLIYFRPAYFCCCDMSVVDCPHC